MTSIGIALGLLTLWAVGMGLVGAYWVKRERRCVEKRNDHIKAQQKLSFPDSALVGSRH